jgi:hypothetical protein
MDRTRAAARPNALVKGRAHSLIALDRRRILVTTLPLSLSLSLSLVLVLSRLFYLLLRPPSPPLARNGLTIVPSSFEMQISSPGALLSP